MARLYHPDLHPEDEEAYTAKFQEITAAYETLSDQDKKAIYDDQYRYHVLGQTAYYEPLPEDYYTAYEPPVKKKRQAYAPYGAFIVLLMYVFRMCSNVSTVPSAATYVPNTYVSPPMQPLVDSSNRTDSDTNKSIFEKKDEGVIKPF